MKRPDKDASPRKSVSESEVHCSLEHNRGGFFCCSSCSRAISSWLLCLDLVRLVTRSISHGSVRSRARLPHQEDKRFG